MMDSDHQDFDGGLIGQSVTTGLMAPNPHSRITWSVVSSDRFPGGLDDVIKAVREQKTWMAVTSEFATLTVFRNG
jgi:hypothetical protein